MARKREILFSVTFLCAVAAQWQSIPVVQHKCPSPPWRNAFHPGQAVFPKADDVCPADMERPLLTREGTLACPTPEAMLYASSAMDHGWRYAGQIGGIDDPKPASIGQAVSAGYYGYLIYHQDQAVKLKSESSPMARGTVSTDIGWINISNFKN